MGSVSDIVSSDVNRLANTIVASSIMNQRKAIKMYQDGQVGENYLQHELHQLQRLQQLQQVQHLQQLQQLQQLSQLQQLLELNQLNGLAALEQQNVIEHQSEDDKPNEEVDLEAVNTNSISWLQSQGAMNEALKVEDDDAAQLQSLQANHYNSFINSLFTPPVRSNDNSAQSLVAEEALKLLDGDTEAASLSMLVDLAGRRQRRPRRLKGISKACIRCHMAKAGCDGCRPCGRCIRLNKITDCLDRPRKKYKKKKNTDNAVKVQDNEEEEKKESPKKKVRKIIQSSAEEWPEGRDLFLDFAAGNAEAANAALAAVAAAEQDYNTLNEGDDMPSLPVGAVAEESHNGPMGLGAVAEESHHGPQQNGAQIESDVRMLNHFWQRFGPNGTQRELE